MNSPYHAVITIIEQLIRPKHNQTETKFMVACWYYGQWDIADHHYNIAWFGYT